MPDPAPPAPDSLEEVEAFVRQRAFAIVRSFHDAEDVAQTVLVKFAVRRESGRDTTDTWAWLTTAIKNAAIDQHRAAGHGQDLHLGSGSAADRPGAVSGPTPPKDQVESVLALLAPKDADIVRLRYVEGVIASEAAKRLDITVSATEQRSSRALGRLRAALNANDHLATELRAGRPRSY